jgi:23S rRNA (cytidine1920-2'-O)/16S rRNA (cytidine1409-2'-O)-methyltransferase
LALPARLDERLVDEGYYPDRACAERACLAGLISVDGTVITQAGTRLASPGSISIKADRRFVSRGGTKLQGALVAFGLNIRGRRCLDVGTSSGGFCDCLLQSGAAGVTAVDVGYGQFDWKLRCDPRVSLYERTNISQIVPEQIGAPFDLVVADLSFTTVRVHLPLFSTLVRVRGDVIILIKPQFELPSSCVGNGIVTDAALQRQAIQLVLDSLGTSGLLPQALRASDLAGHKGNSEFFLWLRRGGSVADIDVDSAVAAAQQRGMESSCRSSL